MHLPGGDDVTFPVETERPNRCVVVKDAGDDPDCTDGARVTATVEWASSGHGTDLQAGPGVGTVTKPGLGLDVGAPAINPVPRRMILSNVAEVTERPLVVTFEVPGGEAMAAKTTNARLGIVGGISILGTTGIVRPFSTAAYRASVTQQVDVAAAQGETTMVLATGSRSEQVALGLRPDLPEVCFVEVGDFTGIALRRAANAGMSRALFVGMVGKITKLAAGVMMTHFHRSKVTPGGHRGGDRHRDRPPLLRGVRRLRLPRAPRPPLPPGGGQLPAAHRREPARRRRHGRLRRRRRRG